MTVDHVGCAGDDCLGAECQWRDRPLFAQDADVTVYWPDVRPCYDADADA